MLAVCGRHLCKILTTIHRQSSVLQLAAMSSAMEKYPCKRFQGKVAVVTASTLGIGLAIAERLGLEGAHVIVSSRKQAQVDAAVTKLKGQGISVAGLVCHVGTREDRTRLLEKAAERNGGIDILVSNAAVNPTYGPLFETSEDAWDKIFDINVKATFLLCKEAFPYLSKRGGSIVIVSSIGGYNPFGLISAYSVSKTALLGLVKAMVPQCLSKNVRVNAIAPGIIKTKFSQALWQEEAGEKVAAGEIPMGRLGVPEECAGAVAFLASDDASYITGETIVMSGGLLSRL